jgi:predicted nucleic acid-binding protein
LARALVERDADWKSDAFALIEFSNILATYERRGSIDRTQAERLQNDTETVLRGLVNISHITALETARRFGVSAYDARFLATAEILRSNRTPLAPYPCRLGNSLICATAGLAGSRFGL